MYTEVEEAGWPHHGGWLSRDTGSDRGINSSLLNQVYIPGGKSGVSFQTLFERVKSPFNSKDTLESV